MQGMCRAYMVSCSAVNTEKLQVFFLSVLSCLIFSTVLWGTRTSIPSSVGQRIHLAEDGLAIKHYTHRKPFYSDGKTGRTVSSWRNREKKFRCDFCSKAFVAHRDCVGHINSVHLGRKPFHCSICFRGFPHQHTLQKHEKICRINP